MRDIWFVNVQRPGQVTDAQDERQLRRHVRKAVFRNRKVSNIGKGIRHYAVVRRFQIVDFSIQESLSPRFERAQMEKGDSAYKSSEN